MTRILLVEDDEEVGPLLEHVLIENRYEVDRTSAVADACSKLEGSGSVGRHVPARREIRRRPLGRDREGDLDLADIGGKAGASAHMWILALYGHGPKWAGEHRNSQLSGTR